MNDTVNDAHLFTGEPLTQIALWSRRFVFQ